MWVGAFGILDKSRPLTGNGQGPVPAKDIFEIVDRLELPCAYDEAVHVLMSLDDECLEIRKTKR